MSIVIMSLVINGCASNDKPKVKEVQKVIYISVPLQKPTKPEIPKISNKDISCLSPDQVDKLISRDMILKGYIADLETVIDSTHD